MAYRRKHGTTRASTLEQDACYHPSEDDNSKEQSKYGFWGVLARKAKAIIEDENDSQHLGAPLSSSLQINFTPTNDDQYNIKKRHSVEPESGQKVDNAKPQRVGNALEGGGMKTAKTSQESHKLQIKTKGSDSDGPWLPIQPTQTQLKASRDVAMATAAKAKLLLRELKTVKADLAFAKQRCAQLEEENKRFRESREKGGSPADDDLIPLQIETLLAEKARLAHENSVYARENRFLREIVEYHHLTMHDLVCLDEGSDDEEQEEEEEEEEQYTDHIEDVELLYSAQASPPEIYNTPKIVKQLISNSASVSHLSSSSSTDQSKADHPNQQEG